MSALRELLATFGFEVDTSALSTADGALGNITDSLASIGKGVLAAFAVEKVFEFGKEILEQADVLAKQSEMLGISTEQLQGWQHAAMLSGSSAEEFTSAFTKFTRNVNEAGEAAAGPAAKAFKALGVDIKDGLTNKLGQPIDLLDGVVAGLQDIHDPAKRTALVMDLFGKSGARLLPLLSEGPEGLAKLRAEVGELGAAFDEAFLENAQEVNDNVDRLKVGLRGLAIQVIGPMLPDLVKLTKGAIEIAKGFIAWVKQTNVTRGVVTALAIKALPLLIGGLRQLGMFALRAVAPFLILEDAIGFLAGDDSVLGEALDKIFGAGTADVARKELLQWFTDVKDVVVNGLAPALLSVTESPLFKGAAKGALDAILAVLRAIGLALSDDADKAAHLATALKKNLQALGLAPGEAETAAALESGKTENQRPLTENQSAFRKGFTAIFGDPLDNPVVRAEAERNNQLAARKRLDEQGIVAGPSSPPIPKGDIASAFQRDQAGPPVAPDYAAAFRPAVATAPATVAGAYTDNSQTTVAPVTNVTVKVEGGASGPDVGNRVGKAAGKVIAGINLKAAQAALVPTPGG